MSELLKPQNLKVPDWRTTHTLKTDLLGLMQSIKTYGILYPIISMEDGTIIDGYARWVIAHDMGLKEVPVTRLQCGLGEAILLHIQMNRCRGQVVPYRLSRAIRTLLKVMSDRDIMNALNMSEDEFDILEDGSLLKKRKVKQQDNNTAWIQIESSLDI